MKKKIDAKRLMAVCCIMLMISSTLLLAGCGKPFTGDQKEEKQITTLAELNGHTIYAQMGTANATALLECKELADSEILYATGNNDGIQKMITGKADAYVCDNLYAQETAAKYDSITVLEETLADSSFGFAFPKNTKYLDKFNKALNKLLKNGTVDELEQKWIYNNTDTTTELTVQNWPGKKGTWKVLCDEDDAPISYLNENGNLAGFDLDVVLAVARELDYKVEFVAKDFASILTNVAAGNYDIGAAGLTITEDREDIVAFSDPYFSNSTVVLVKDLGSGSSDAESIKLTVGSALYKVFVENERYMLLLDGI